MPKSKRGGVRAGAGRKKGEQPPKPNIVVRVAVEVAARWDELSTNEQREAIDAGILAVKARKEPKRDYFFD